MDVQKEWHPINEQLGPIYHIVDGPINKRLCPICKQLEFIYKQSGPIYKQTI